MHTTEAERQVAGRRRRRHSEQFKAEAVQACTQPGVSMAAVALAHGINANLLRRWVLQRRSGQDASPEEVRPAFVPLALAGPVAAGPAEPAEIRIEAKRGATCLNIRWPVSDAAGCAAWLHELLR